MPKKKTALTIEERLQQALVPAEEQPYEVPENWVWTYWKNCGELIAGSGFKKEFQEKKNLPIPFYKVGSLKFADNLGFLYDGENTIDEPIRNILKATLIKEHSIIFAKIGEAIRLNRRAVNAEKCCIDNNLMAFTVNTVVLWKYAYFWTLGLDLYSYTNSTTVPAIRKSDIELINFPLPPLSEQQRIVERIEELFAKLDEAKERLQEVADSFAVRKAAILHKAFTGELTKQWRRENGVSDESWEESNLGSFIACGPQNGLYKPKSSYGDGIRIIRIDAFYDGVIEQWDELKRLRLDENEIECYSLNLNDILINRVNSMQYLGKSALVRELKDICVFESNIMRLSVDESRIYPEFLSSFLNSQMGLNELRKNAKQAVNQASINQQDIKNVIINLPTLPEQHEIVRLIDDLLARERKAQQATEQALASIDLMKKSILARAFRGELGMNKASALELLRQVLAEN